MKVLDRVRVIHDEHPRYIGEIGTVGTVFEQRRDKRGRIIPATRYPISVRFDRPVDGLIGRWFAPEDLEVIDGQ